MTKVGIFIFLIISLFEFVISNEWSDKIDCHLSGNDTKTVHLICDNVTTGAYTKDNCHHSLFKDGSKEDKKANLVILKAGCCVFADINDDFSDSFLKLRKLDISLGSVNNFLFFPF